VNTGGWPSSPSGKAPSCLRRDSSRSWIFSKPSAPLGCCVCQIRPSLPTQQTINFNHSNYFLKHIVCDKDMNYLHLSHLSFGLPIFKKCTLVLIGTLPLYLSTNVDTINCTVTFILICGLTQHICSIYMNGQHVHVRACTQTHTATTYCCSNTTNTQVQKITWHKTQEEFQLEILMETLCNGMHRQVSWEYYMSAGIERRCTEVHSDILG